MKYHKPEMLSDVMDWIQLHKSASYYANELRGRTAVLHREMRDEFINIDNTIDTSATMILIMIV